MGATLAELFGLAELTVTEPPTLDEVELRTPRVRAPDFLASLCTVDPGERASHTYGKSFRDLVRAFARDYSRPPDLVALPREEADVVRLLDWCSEAEIAAIPYGGGSSVVGGVEPDVGDSYRGAVTIDLRHLGRVLDVDEVSHSARIQAGVYGPALEDQLRPHGLTLRHFPQSFEFSTLGGWIATRSGGHYATLFTHIDEFVESLRAVTPQGVLESRRLPGSGAGPSPDRLLLGSEGTLGVITEAWMRLRRRPRFRARATVRFADFATGARATRALVQAGLHPSNCRLLDPNEALVTGADDSGAAVLLVAFESADHPLETWLARALECCRDHGGTSADEALTEDAPAPDRDDASSAWRRSFLRAPYTRDALVGLGLINETFETSITWDRYEALHEAVMRAVEDALHDVGSGSGIVTCRFTHVYPDGPAPYFTVIAPGRAGARLEQWAIVKEAASEAILDAGGTITHHHAVGRDHRHWYDRQRPEPFAAALRAAKAALDPALVCNPGVLVDARP